jgi:hypothetical protein
MPNTIGIKKTNVWENKNYSHTPRAVIDSAQIPHMMAPEMKDHENDHILTSKIVKDLLSRQYM